MTDRPILFSAQMVRALLEGKKTQTRRLAWKHEGGGIVSGPMEPAEYDAPEPRPTIWQKVQPGDRLWVREGWVDEHPSAIQPARYSQEGRAGIPGPPGVRYRTIYRADGEPLQVWNCGDYPYRTLDGPQDEIAVRHPEVCSNYARNGNSIYWENALFMPRWASRLTLEVTATKMERVQDISESDASAEGLRRVTDGLYTYYRVGEWKDGHAGYSTAGAAFKELWGDLHGADSWDANPEVVALTFTVHKRNIDAA